MRYATLTLRRRNEDLDGIYSVIIESPPHGKRAAFVFPIEGDRWIVDDRVRVRIGRSE